jgi:ligand-binding sensor domain-containing protein
MPHPSPLAVVLLLQIASCSGRVGPAPTAEPPLNNETLRDEQDRTPPAEADTAAQIAEYVVEAFEDSHGVLWFGTIDKGVARYDGKALTYLTEKDGLCGNTIVSIAEDKDSALWFAGHTGVCKYDGTTFTPFFKVEGSVRTDRSGGIWVSTNDTVYRYDSGAFTAFPVPLPAEPPAAYSIRPGRARFELEDSQGHLWFTTDGCGAFRCDRSTALGAGRASFTQFTKQDGLCSNTVWSILEDRQRRIWFTCIQAFQPEMTGDGGVSRYDGKTFTTFADVPGLSRNDIYTIYEDRSAQIWIGATGVGAYRYDGNEFTLFDKTDRPDLTMNFGLQALKQDRNATLWCGFSGGLFRFGGSSFVNVTQQGPWKSLSAGDR